MQEQLAKELEALRQANTLLLLDVKKKDEKIAFLSYQVAEMRRLIFGTKTERFVPVNPNQLQLNIPGLEVVVKEAQPERETIIVERKKAAPRGKDNLPVRGFIPEHLRRETEVIMPGGIDHENGEKIGEEITEVLEYKKAEIYVRRIERPKYKTAEGKIVIADLPANVTPLKRSNVAASFLAHILVSKYIDHLPLYRQRKQLLRDKMDVSASTINDWFMESGKLIKPLYELLSKKIKECNYLQVDETPIKVLESQKKAAPHRGYFWAYLDPVNKLQYFEYSKSRSKEPPNIFLKDFKGYLQSDGYAAYDHFDQRAEIKLLACMAHVRRKFEHALDNDNQRAAHALTLIAKLYKIESNARQEHKTLNELYQIRGEQSVPVLAELESWLKEQVFIVLPRSVMGQAIAYTLKLWKRLKVYVLDPILEIDNNLVENKIRPIALGRKNYLFNGSHQAAEIAAMYYTLFANCALHNINPEDWLCDIFRRINEHKINTLQELLPNQWSPAKI